MMASATQAVKIQSDQGDDSDDSSDEGFLPIIIDNGSDKIKVPSTHFLVFFLNINFSK